MSDVYVPFPASVTGAIAHRALVPAWLVSLSAVLVPVFTAGFTLLPHPYSVVAAVLAFVAAGLAGVAMPQFKFTRPVIPLTLVPSALTLGGLLGSFAASVEAPLWKGCLGLLSALCFALAGKALPAPTRQA